jgi:diacylglycerol kinase family enzyme
VRYLLIMNPSSRSGRGKRLWNAWEDALKQAGIDYESSFTEGPGHAMELARTAGTDVVVAVGGDGTINEVLDGVIQSGNTSPAMGVLYSGTSPDFCRFHGIPIKPPEAIDALLSGRKRKVDVGRISYRDDAGLEHVAHFGCSCNIGMGASVARFANKWRRHLGDVLGTGAGVIYALARNARADISLNIDGKEHLLPEVNNLTIAKNPHIASGLKFSLDLQPDDGKLAVIGIHSRSRAGIFRLLPSFYSGTVTAEKGIFLEECGKVDISSLYPQEIEFDGDPRGFLPVRIEVLPRALTLIGGANE